MAVRRNKFGVRLRSCRFRASRDVEGLIANRKNPPARERRLLGDKQPYHALGATKDRLRLPKKIRCATSNYRLSLIPGFCGMTCTGGVK